MSRKFLGQAAQDYFVMNVWNRKQNGYFVEIGSADAITDNNTYILEKNLNWKGIMVEYNSFELPKYIQHRQNSKHYIADATTLNFKDILDTNKFPSTIDYLQIDLEVENRSTLSVLEHFDTNVFPYYIFGVVTFEHDIYRGDFFNTRQLSRNIFEKYGYVRVFSDICANKKNEINAMPFEDWYVHPALVNMEYIQKIKRDESLSYEVIEEILDNIR